MKKINTKNITACAVIAAVYIVLSLAFAPISFGAVQFRVSEALTLLPVFSPYTIIGVTLGCLITNIAG
ncbi:MAG: QueT transporter family protein, partial [Hydrogenoanaerobacterium sp.]